MKQGTSAPTITPTVSIMDNDAVNEYLDKLIAGKLAVEEPLEQRAVESFRQISGRIDSLSAALRRAENQVEGFKSEMASATGEMKAYANILAGAEDVRRSVAIEVEKAQISRDADSDAEVAVVKDSASADEIDNVTPMKSKKNKAKAQK